MAQLVGASSCTPKGCGFDSNLGTYLGCGFDPRPGCGTYERQPINVSSFFLPCFLPPFLPLSLPPPLFLPFFFSKINRRILRGGLKVNCSKTSIQINTHLFLVWCLPMMCLFRHPLSPHIHKLYGMVTYTQQGLTPYSSHHENPSVGLGGGYEGEDDIMKMFL